MTKSAASDPYTVLGIARGTPIREARDAYRALAKRYHPDLSPGASELSYQRLNLRMSEINAAWSVVEAELSADKQVSQEDARKTARQSPSSWQKTPPPKPQAQAPTASKPKRPPTAAQRMAKEKAEADRKRATKRINPKDLPLDTLPNTQLWWGYKRNQTADRLWTDVGLEPVILRVGGKTGFTLCRTLAEGSTSRRVPFSDGQDLLVAQSISGLISLVKDRSVGGAFLDPVIRSVLVKRIRISSVTTKSSYRFDLPEISRILYEQRNADLNSRIFADCYAWLYQMSMSLGWENISGRLTDGSPIHQLYDLACKLKKPSSLFWGRSWKKWQRFDTQQAFLTFDRIKDKVEKAVQWHK